VHIDLGAGDGGYVSARARREPGTLFIGVEPDHASLIEASRTAMRRASPGESNLIFVLGAWQDLPGQLAGLASSVSVLFPWGSLLQAVATADNGFVQALQATAAPAADIEFVTAIQPDADAGELRRLGLGPFSPAALADAWRAHGYAVEQHELPADHAYQTSWWRRIRHRPGRVATLTRVSLPGPARQ
jgi:hypothetical protein